MPAAAGNITIKDAQLAAVSAISVESGWFIGPLSTE